MFLQTHADHSLPPYLVGRAKKRSGRAHEEMTENSFPKTDSEMTDCRGQIGHEQLLTEVLLVEKSLFEAELKLTQTSFHSCKRSEECI